MNDGNACARFRDETVRNLSSKRAQRDEAWSFCYTKCHAAARVFRAWYPGNWAGGARWAYFAMEAEAPTDLARPLGGDGVEVSAVAVEHRLPAGEVLPALYRNTDISRRDLNRVRHAAGHLGRDYRRAGAGKRPMTGFAFADCVPARLVLPMVVPAPDYEARLVPDNLRPKSKAASFEARRDLVRVQATVPNISDGTREEGPGLTLFTIRLGLPPAEGMLGLRMAARISGRP